MCRVDCEVYRRGRWSSGQSASNMQIVRLKDNVQEQDASRLRRQVMHRLTQTRLQNRQSTGQKNSNIFYEHDTLGVTAM